ncbi:hypothetical protein ACFY3O_28655 [Streptomyces sp. NPDC001046]|uniref:hypothetical protein n=1 Tax=Streptomyces sp. NPDC001046 TaxID=3364543 RepID=UPI00369A281E
MTKKDGRGGRCRVVATAVLAGLLGSVQLPSAHAAGDTVPADFNGNGYRDVVLRVPGFDVGGREGAGAVIVLYGSSSGLSAKSRAVITQNSPGVPGSAEQGDYFGASTASDLRWTTVTRAKLVGDVCVAIGQERVRVPGRVVMHCGQGRDGTLFLRAGRTWVRINA